MKLTQLRLKSPVNVSGRGNCDTFDVRDGVTPMKRARSIEVTAGGHFILTVDDSNAFYVPCTEAYPSRIDVASLSTPVPVPSTSKSTKAA